MFYKSKINCSFLPLILLCMQICLAQEQRVADSLVNIYKNDKFLSTLEKITDPFKFFDGNQHGCLHLLWADSTIR